MTIKNRTKKRKVVQERDVVTCDICGIDETIADLQRVVGNPSVEVEYVILEDPESSAFGTRHAVAQYARGKFVDQDASEDEIDHLLSQKGYAPRTHVRVEGDFEATCCDHCKSTLLSVYDGPKEQETEGKIRSYIQKLNMQA